MMELATSPHCSVWSLTYDEETEVNRDAARMFVYQDVVEWLKRVRSALAYKYEGQRTWVRFIVAGEQGDKKGRCHWHVILYSSHEVQTVGTFHGFKPGTYGKTELRWPEDREHMVTVERKKAKRLDWDLWGKGFITLQGPGFEIMHYVLSYCLMDQFTVEKSKDTGRETTAENFATGLFRMSKRPAIGEGFIFKRLADLAERGECLPSLSLKVPGVKGYYVPSGRMRELMLWGLVGLNQTVRNTTGRDAPQWSTLLQACKDNQTDLEVLSGPQVEDPDDVESVETEFARRGREFVANRQRSETVRNCGGILPCAECLSGFTDERLREFGLVRFETEGIDGETVWHLHSLPGFESYKTRATRRGPGLNPFCAKAGSKSVRDAFPLSGYRPEADPRAKTR